MSHDTLARPTKTDEPSRERVTASRRRRHWTRRANPVAGLGAFIWLAIVLIPIYAMLSASLTGADKALTGNPLKPPANPTLDNYNTVLTSGFGHLLSNTAIVAVSVVGIVLTLSIPLAYVTVRTRDRWSNAAFRLFLLGVAIPAQAVVVPLYLLIAKLDLYDTLLAVILPTAAFAMPVSVLVLVGTLRDVSEDLYEAMALDGASPLRMLFQLTIPLAKGGISTVVIFSALQAWNGFLFPLIFTQSDEPRVLTLGLFNYVSQFGINIPALLASVVLSGIPIFAVYLVARRALVGGLMGVGGK
ncbi:carbohydrate ABC transporter permease [Streptomyces europaeiscabiei]|uniref:Carbohydrate ABC transporter permease n=1 Tax=Streptomyces europaeiscabiei TaxID=146819 RepID=A0ABU4NCD5_9ACTN|nr:carbohydrate ABC transporter permease [Streptomyces europaeiscabiei]MDX2525608.1 carbohydrate ABC transporter permease [Streptomyces europaeiscabiei]MDX2761519.1 carbohydrate ABC transporter permease [Streptomyces europaeiscabiei]MDX2771188.1 carbohydrate ABC transporter permease [Streptomyces europaeiscabiei]MDX3542967.1 carbohydrate ABC transporter permease [Streptomyces europaeiscabiei]MDX3552783.1 carbohydrate ABC transporter permease [Streptomyces europaeiscabiei]